MEIDDSSLLPNPDAATTYVIYDHPVDHPEYFVVRPFDVEDGKPKPRKVAGLFHELEKARGWCQQLGLIRMERTEEDNSTVVEVWL